MEPLLSPRRLADRRREVYPPDRSTRVQIKPQRTKSRFDRGALRFSVGTSSVIRYASDDHKDVDS
jgi:hypothetical protein